MLLLAALGTMLLIGVSDLMELTFSILFISATAGVLVAYPRRSRRAEDAAMKLCLARVLASEALLLDFVHLNVQLYGRSDTTTFPGIPISQTRIDAPPLSTPA